MKITITSKYPLEAPIVELSSASLPMPLLRNKEKECVETNNKTMTKTQYRKWEREQKEKKKAVDEACCFEEITRVASLSDSAKEHYYKTGIILANNCK